MNKLLLRYLGHVVVTSYPLTTFKGAFRWFFVMEGRISNYILLELKSAHTNIFCF